MDLVLLCKVDGLGLLEHVLLRQTEKGEYNE
jgi:hypothetical protein